MAAMTMSSRAASAGAGERRLQRVNCCGDLPRPIRPVPCAAGLRPGTPRPGYPAGGAAPWWGAGARQASAAAQAPRRQRSCSRGARPVARVPTGKGNRELVRRALAPPAARGRGGPVLIRRWSFRPAPSRLRKASSPSPVSPRPRLL